MRKVYAVGLLLSGISLWSCGDEKQGPGVGPETSWQIACAEGASCGVAEDAHGPLAGTEEDDPDDDVKIKVSCSHTSAGIQLRLEDPGEEDPDPPLKARARSVVQITNIKLDDDRCTVKVTEYPRDGSQLEFIDQCSGTLETGTCTIEAEEDSGGYALSGTISCENMKAGSGGKADYALRRARMPDEPMVLQIANCR